MMKVLIEIAADGDFCRTGYGQCDFFASSGPWAVCRAFREPSTSKKCPSRAARLPRDDSGRFERCRQCKDATVPNAPELSRATLAVNEMLRKQVDIHGTSSPFGALAADALAEIEVLAYWGPRWEAEHKENERLRKLLQQVLADAQSDDVLLGWWNALECEAGHNACGEPGLTELGEN